MHHPVLLSWIKITKEIIIESKNTLKTSVIHYS